MTWIPPSYIEIDMSAEIGAYQADGDGNAPHAPSTTDQHEMTPRT